MRAHWRMHFVRSESFRNVEYGDGPLWTHVLRIDALTGNPECGLAGIFGAAIEFGAVECGDPKLLALLLALDQAAGAILRRQSMTVGSFRRISEPNESFAQCRCPLRPRAAPNVVGTIGCAAFQLHDGSVAASNERDMAAQIDERLLSFNGPPTIGARECDNGSIGRNAWQYVVFGGVGIGSGRRGCGNEHFRRTEFERTVGFVFDRHFDDRPEHRVVTEQPHIIGIAVVGRENHEIARG